MSQDLINTSRASSKVGNVEGPYALSRRHSRYECPKCAKAKSIKNSVYIDHCSACSLTHVVITEEDIITPEPTTVIMPLDPSDHSEYCMHYYLKYIHRPENKVYPCFVAEDFLKNSGEKRASETSTVKSGEAPPKTRCCAFLKNTFFNKVLVDVGPSPGILAELEKEDKRNCHKVKLRVKILFTANHVNFEFRRLTGQDPGTAILNFRKEVNGNMIIMGSRGMGKLKRKIFGSVSDKILQCSTVPVLVVKKSDIRVVQPKKRPSETIIN